MKDQICIEGLLLRTILGVHETQRNRRQDVRIDLRLTTRIDWPGISDKLEDAVNYQTIAKRVVRLVEQARFYLLEKLTAEIAAICLDDYRVERVHVRVEKPGALRYAHAVAVEIERTRADLAPTRHRAFLVLSSDGVSHVPLRIGVEQLQTSMTVLALSPIYKRPREDAKPYLTSLHAAALVETPLTPAQLKQRLRDVEEAVEKLSRREEKACSFRLGIALYDRAAFDLGEGQIPHPSILTQAHVAIPLADLAPAYHHPETEAPLEEIADRLPDAGIEKTDITL